MSKHLWLVEIPNKRVRNQPAFREHLTMTQTKIYTDWCRAVPSSPGPNHPSQDLYSICGDVSSSINRFLPNRRTVQHNLHKCLADGNMELQNRQRITSRKKASAFCSFFTFHQYWFNENDRFQLGVKPYVQSVARASFPLADINY